MSYKILVASYTDSIHSLQFDPTTSPPTLQLVKSTKVGHHPSWITRHPDAPSLAFTGLEQSDGRLLVLKIGDDSDVEVLADVSSAGRDPCTILVLENQVLVGNVSLYISFLCFLAVNLYLFYLHPVFFWYRRHLYPSRRSHPFLPAIIIHYHCIRVTARSSILRQWPASGPPGGFSSPPSVSVQKL